MPIPFNLYDYLTWNDFERCPYASFSLNPLEREKAYDWIKKDDKRMLLIALDRYTDRIIKECKIKYSCPDPFFYLKK